MALPTPPNAPLSKPLIPIKININPHGVFSVFAILAFLAMIFVKIGNVPWIYAVLAIVGYAAAVIVLTLALSRVEREIATTKSQRGFSQDTLEKTEEEYFLYFRLLYGNTYANC